MLKTILVPTDGSPSSIRALPYAAALARAADGEILLVRAVKDPAAITASSEGMPAIIDVQKVEKDMFREATASLAALAALVTNQGLKSEEEIVEYRDVAASAIVAAAQEHHADIIAMSTHGRSGLGRMVYGSVAEEVLTRSHLPVLLVPPHASAQGWVARSGTAHRIVVPLDGSALAEEALGPATELAKTLGAGMTVIRVLEMLVLAVPDSTPVVAGDDEDDREAARTYLAGVVNRLTADGVSATGELLHGNPSDLIGRAGGEADVDAIVAATHGRTGVSRAVLGSVATGLLHGARVPVLLVRPAAVQAQHAEPRAGA